MVVQHMLAMGVGFLLSSANLQTANSAGPHRHLGKRPLCHPGASRNANELQEHVCVPG